MARVYGVIYKITNTVNGKVYIGQTTQKLYKRWADHCSSVNKSCKALHNSIKKYGKDAFICEAILSCVNKDNLNWAESYFIKFYNSFGEFGYNLSEGGYNYPGYKNRTSVVAYNFETGQCIFLSNINKSSTLFDFDARSIHRCLKGVYTAHKNCVFVLADDFNEPTIKALIQKDLNRRLKLKKKNSNCSSRGVVKTGSKYFSYFKKNGKTICLGSYTTELEAFAAYKAAFLEVFYRKSA